MEAPGDLLVPHGLYIFILGGERSSKVSWASSATVASERPLLSSILIG